MTTSLDEYVNQRYQHLLRIANGLCRNNEGSELLHAVIENVYSNHKATANELLIAGKLDNYLARSLRYEFYRSQKEKLKRVEFTNQHEPPPVWLGARLDNEMMDAAVDLSRLSSLELKVWRLHVDHGYSVKEISEGAEVTERYIYGVLGKARVKIKKVIRKK